MKSRSSIRRTIRCLFTLLPALLFSPTPSHALLYDYTYVGKPFDEVTGIYTSSDRVTISLLSDHPLVAAPREEATNQSGDMLSFLMSDGHQTRDAAQEGFGELEIFGLNAGGTPFGWWIWIADNQEGTGNTVFSENSPDGATDFASLGADYGRNFQEGVWTVAVKCDNPVPEPSTATLVAIGSAGMLGSVIWRRRTRRYL